MVGGQVSKQTVRNGAGDATVNEMRRELARKIAAHVPAAGHRATAVPGLGLIAVRTRK
jgi:hypothetical protein